MDVKLKEWIVDKLSKTPSAELFSLYHATVEGLGGGGGELLQRRPVNGKSEDIEQEAETIMLEFIGIARNHCEAFDGIRQRYKVLAETSSDVLGSYPFALGAKMQSLDIGLSEPATEKGLMGQLMRHCESLSRQNVEMTQAVISPLIAENQALRRQRDGWEEKRMEAHLTLEELLSLKHVRDLELAEFERGEGRKNKFWEAFLSKWGPEIIKKFGVPALAGSLPSAEVNGKKPDIESCQSTLRGVFKVLDKAPIYDCLDDERRTKLDGLLGLSDNPESIEVFKEHLIGIWKSLPDEVTNSIGEKLALNHPDRAKALLDLMGMELEGAEQ
jgi:hypothetical protein